MQHSQNEVSRSQASQGRICSALIFFGSVVCSSPNNSEKEQWGSLWSDMGFEKGIYAEEMFGDRLWLRASSKVSSTAKELVCYC